MKINKKKGVGSKKVTSKRKSKNKISTFEFLQIKKPQWFSLKQYSLGMLLSAMIITVITTLYYQGFALASEHSERSVSPTPTPINTKTSPLEVIGQEQVPNDLAIGGSSYAGEVVSKLDVNVYSAREGVITSLSVGIGDTVWKGQAIGQLSFPVEFDQLATTAEKRGDIDSARGELDAINTQLNDVRNRLNGRKSTAEAAKNAKIANANNSASNGTITSQEKEELIKEAESEYSEVVTSADNEITNITRDQKGAEKGLQVAESVSKTVSGGLDRNIYAVRGGVISGIFKNVGDSVGISDQIAAIGIANPSIKDRCVRFRIPGNQTVPKVGDTVTISRPGLPLATEVAKITGVGTALDDNGHYVAEAFFEKIVDWPVHTQVRVKVNSQIANQIYIPLSAVWFDNEGVTSVWVADSKNKITAYNVKTGRAVGDRIEITKGIIKGDRVVLNPQEDFKNGDIIKETGSVNANTGKGVQPEGDGHDHEH